MAARELFEIWEEPGTDHPWKAQLVNYVGSFLTQGHAERYVEAVKRHLASMAPAPVKSKK